MVNVYRVLAGFNHPKSLSVGVSTHLLAGPRDRTSGQVERISIIMRLTLQKVVDTRPAFL